MDFVHCPPNTKHTIVGAGDGASVVVAVGARAHSTDPGWGGYTVDETAARHGVSVEQDTSEPLEAYAGLETLVYDVPRRLASRPDVGLAGSGHARVRR